HRGATADGDAQPAEIGLADLRMRNEPAVQRVDAGEDGAARLAQHRDEIVDVAWVRDQPVLGADRKIADEIYHQREDVIERQRRNHHLLARAQGVRYEGLELLGIGADVAMRQRRALGKPGGAAGILQEQQVIAREFYRDKVELGALRQRVRERG